MQAYDPQRAGYPPVPPNPTPAPDAVDRMLAFQSTPKPWFISIIENLRELSAQKKQPPLQVSFRPMTDDELRDSDDPVLRQLAHFNEEKSFVRSLRENLKELFNPTKLPPLQLTSRPLTKEEMWGQVRSANWKSPLCRGTERSLADSRTCFSPRSCHRCR